jgi:hypothetical protein
MKFIKPLVATRLVAIGLLSTVLPTLINDFCHIPDFFRGEMMGLGLGMEIVGIILLRKGNNSACKRSGTNAEV